MGNLSLIKDIKLHLIALCVVVASEAIGMQKIGFIILPSFIFALIVAGIISLPRLKCLSHKNMQHASQIINILLCLIIAKLGLEIGPNLEHIYQVKFALLLQEVGHFIGTILLGLPLAIMLGMGREAVGATYSIAREHNIAIIANRYGLDSPEGRGVMSMYFFGTLFGAIWISILTNLLVQTQLFHPYALAMGAGVGSGSMMSASTGVIASLYPAYATNIYAYAASANLLSGILGIYIYMFFSLPLTSKLYDLFTANKVKNG